MLIKRQRNASLPPSLSSSHCFLHNCAGAFTSHSLLLHTQTLSVFIQIPGFSINRDPKERNLCLRRYAPITATHGQRYSPYQEVAMKGHSQQRLLQEQTLQVHRNLWQNFCSGVFMCIFAIWGPRLEMALKESTCANATPQNLDLDPLLCGKHKACQRNVWFAESLDQTRERQHSFCRPQPGPSFPASQSPVSTDHRPLGAEE